MAEIDYATRTFRIARAHQSPRVMVGFHWTGGVSFTNTAESAARLVHRWSHDHDAQTTIHRVDADGTLQTITRSDWRDIVAELRAMRAECATCQRGGQTDGAHIA